MVIGAPKCLCGLIDSICTLIGSLQVPWVPAGAASPSKQQQQQTQWSSLNLSQLAGQTPRQILVFLVHLISAPKEPRKEETGFAS